MKQIATRYGIIAGVAVVGYMLLFYLIDKSVMLGWKVYWSSFFLYLVCMYKACVTFRTTNNDLLNVQEGTRTAFITFLVANVIFYVFYYILFNYVDTDLVTLQMEAAKEMYHTIMGKEEAKKMIDVMKKEGFEMTIGTTIWEFAKGAIGGFILSLIIAGITRRD